MWKVMTRCTYNKRPLAWLEERKMACKLEARQYVDEVTMEITCPDCQFKLVREKS